DALKLAEELLKSDTEYDLDFKKSIYSLLLKVYERTEQKDLYIETYKKLKWEEDKLNKEIKKDYIEYIAANYKLGVAHEINERLLVIILIVTFICLITAIVIIILILHNKKVKHDGDLDGLSQVYNRKYLEKDIKRMLERRGISLSIGILILDIDYFKLYNDFYGHPAGDLVIKQVASCLKASVRNEDIIIRYGGEEFLILLKNIDQHMLESICNRIKMELKKMSIPHEKSEVEKVVTVSIGGTIHTICSYEQLLEQIKVADSNLYRAKKNGRNQYQLK
ncbi:MAG: GGDEF domain-containing protein, partial [Clostridiales bacterium]|nr:GGDEF domain-containing protein [Clostridiales bacterium]